jgi:branched-subunit amino acid aminotransferase/4-amino-4-deoxychorismate lyase
MKSVHFLDGKLVNEDDLLISPRDLGYSRGYAAFDFMITSRGHPFMMHRHIDRLYRSCQSILLNLPWSKEQIADWVLQTLEANEPVEGERVIRITISGGTSGTLTPPKTPTIVITIDSRIPCPPEDYANGVHVLLSEFERHEPQAKTNNYVEAVRQFNSISKDIDEIIYYSEDMVREGTRSNVFAVINGSLVTPKTGILEGITRGVIINELGLSVQAKAMDFSVQELLDASEVFITATGKEVMPVTKINDSPVGDGSVGNVTREVMTKFRDFFESDLW